MWLSDVAKINVNSDFFWVLCSQSGIYRNGKLCTHYLAHAYFTGTLFTLNCNEVYKIEDCNDDHNQRKKGKNIHITDIAAHHTPCHMEPACPQGLVHGIFVAKVSFGQLAGNHQCMGFSKCCLWITGDERQVKNLGKAVYYGNCIT